MKKILIIANDESTILNFRREIVAALVQAGFDVTVCYPLAENTQSIESLGCKVVDVRVSRHGTDVFRFLVSMATPTLAFIYKDKIAEFDNPYINVMVNMSLITGGLYAVGVVTSGIYMGRLPLYTNLFGLILLPFILKRVLPKQAKGPVWVAAFIIQQTGLAVWI